ncbi:unnamed protein product, partial [Staurois parvus]
MALYHVISDHSQISHVSNDVRSDMLTTLHVITDWPISDHMIGTSQSGPERQSVFHCVRRTQRAPDRGAACIQRARTVQNGRRCFINCNPPLPARPSFYYRMGGKWL